VDWIVLVNRRQRVRINCFFSFRRKVLSGIPQGLILGPLSFVTFINDLVDNCNNGSDVFLYADDAKLFRHITCNNGNNDGDLSQKDLLNIQVWMEKCLLKLNIKICKVVS